MQTMPPGTSVAITMNGGFDVQRTVLEWGVYGIVTTTTGSDLHFYPYNRISTIRLASGEPEADPRPAPELAAARVGGY